MPWLISTVQLNLLLDTVEWTSLLSDNMDRCLLVGMEDILFANYGLPMLF